MADINLTWSGVEVTVTDEYLDLTRVSVNMEQSRAFRDWRVPRAIELAQRNLDAMEGDDSSEELKPCWQCISENYISGKRMAS